MRRYEHFGVVPITMAILITKIFNGTTVSPWQLRKDHGSDLYFDWLKLGKQPYNMTTIMYPYNSPWTSDSKRIYALYVD